MSLPALRVVETESSNRFPGSGFTQARSVANELQKQGIVNEEFLARAQASLIGREVSLGDALTSCGAATQSQIVLAETGLCGGSFIDLDAKPPDARLIDTYGPENVLRDRVLPWRRKGATTVIVASRATDYYAHLHRLSALFGPTQLAFATENGIVGATLSQRRRNLARTAETRVPEHESCRSVCSRFKKRGALALVALLCGLVMAFPSFVLGSLFVWALATLAATMALKIAAGVAMLAPDAHRPQHSKHRVYMPSPAPPPRLRKVSILVPLFKEREIAGRLLKRLERLDYPRELLDVCLIIENGDTTTQSVIRDTRLPAWMRIITVPPGELQTKPRALNYALDFARGSIIGVYDAEDAPAPDQISRVVAEFHTAPPDVGCLQGVLDFYNARQNWLSRCFTIDYATWFRVILPGLSRLGLVIPLGGTTVFFRRDVLDRLGGWDAHNVTEDADLGIRLARRGYRTKLIATETGEEANCRMLPWIRQRSRWLKGYAMTYATHMQSPRKLLSDLGSWKFLGFQILFLGTLSQFLLAPFLWSFWLVFFGFAHPFTSGLGDETVLLLVGLFLLSEITNIVLGCFAVRGPRHRWLAPWVPTLHVYWPLGAIASYKAIWEMVNKPFFWDKTSHGMTYCKGRIHQDAS